MNIDKYNLIIPYIRRAGYDIKRFRKFFTQSLENKPEHLLQWISYLSEANLLEAALALNDLANQDEELKEIVFKKTIDAPFNHQVILTLLYLNKHDKIVERLNNGKDNNIKDDGDDLEYSYEQYDEEFTKESLPKTRENLPKKEEEQVVDQHFVKIYESYTVPESLSKENRYVIKHLLDKSNYNLIIDYMLDLSKSNKQNAIYKIAKSIDKIVVNDETKSKIKEIINNLINGHKYCLAIQIVFSLGLKFEEYIDIKPEEYMIILSENYHSLESLNFEKILYLKNHNLKQYFNYIKDLDLDNELAMHTLKIVLNLIINGDDPFLYEDTINAIIKHYKDNNIFLMIIEFNELFCRLFNKIIRNNPNDLIKVIKLFDCTNPFMYNEMQKSIQYVRVRNLINEQIQLNKIINNITSNNSISNKDKIFIYMNSHFKSLIDLTEYIVKFINIPNELTKIDVSDLFSDYYFYVRINKIDKKNGRIRMKLINITENNKIRNSKSKIERLLGHMINVGLIIKTHISHYLPYDTSFLLDYICIGNKISFSKEDYEAIYNDLINNINSSDELLNKLINGKILNYNDMNESNRIYDIYYKTINNSYNNHENYIIVLEKDYVNPFRWPSSGPDSIETPELLTTKKYVHNYFSKNYSNKEEDSNIGFIRRTEIYNNFIKLIESDGSIDEIIKIYMNTFTRYVISINDLLKLLISNNRITPNENGIIDLRELFNDYTIYGKPIEYNDITQEALLNSHLLWSFRLIYKTDNYSSLTEKHCYIKFNLDYLDIKTNNIYLYNVSKSRHIIISQDLIYIDKQLNTMRTYGLTPEIENNIKKIAPIELFNDIISFKKDHKNQIYRHASNYILTISKYINDLDIIAKLIDALGDNNFFKYSSNIALGNVTAIQMFNGYSMSKDKFNIACQKEKDINKLLYIYLNTFLRFGIQMDKILNNYCIVNHLYNQEIDITEKTNIELFYSEEEDKIKLKYFQYDKNNTNIVVLNNDLVKDKIYLANLIKYQPNTNTLTFKIVKEKGE